MTFTEFQDGALKTWNPSPTLEEQVENALYGLMGELGEFVELYKKQKFHKANHSKKSELKELGDVLYYLAVLCHVRGFNFDVVATVNAEKLKNRYPAGFVSGGGIR